MMNWGKVLKNAPEGDSLFDNLSQDDIEECDLSAGIAIKIASKRGKMGLTQKDLAVMMGVTEEKVSRWESGDCNFRVEKLRKIFSKLGYKMTIKIKRR